MALDRTAPISPILRLPTLPQGLFLRAATVPGDILQLRVGEVVDGALLLHDEQAQPLRLTTDMLNGQILTPGQVLRVQVLSVSPQLELMLLDHLGEGFGGSTLGNHAPNTADPGVETEAMRLDQAAMYRMSTLVVDTPALAARWRALVLERLQQFSTVPEGIGLPATPFTPVSANRAASAQDMSALMFQAAAWAGMGVKFWLLHDTPDEEGPAARPRRQSLRLRLVLNLPEMGPARVDLLIFEQTVSLTLTAEQPRAVPVLRGRVGVIATRLALAGLRLVRCQVNGGPAMAAPLPVAASVALHTLSEAALSVTLFRAASETVAAFSPPFR